MPYGEKKWTILGDYYQKNMKEYHGKEIILMATSRCNMNCKHCYISYNGSREPQELLSLVRTLKNKYSLNINGAENLTELGYLDSYQEINQTWILTNGKILYENPEVIEYLLSKGIKSVSLSYHYKIQDSISGISLEKLNELLSKLNAMGMQYKFMTTITSQNYKYINEMCEDSYRLGAKGIKFTNYICQGNAQNLDESNILNDEQLKSVFEQIKNVREKFDKSEFVIDRCGTFGPNISGNKDNFYCDCITDSIVITPDNNVYPCVFLAKPGFEIGKYDPRFGVPFVSSDFVNNHDECLVKEVCNNKKLLKRKKEL